MRGYQLCTQGWSLLLRPLPGPLTDKLGIPAVLYSIFSQTQSQELGAETVVDNEMLYDLGMVSFFNYLPKWTCLQ